MGRRFLGLGPRPCGTKGLCFKALTAPLQAHHSALRAGDETKAESRVARSFLSFVKGSDMACRGVQNGESITASAGAVRNTLQRRQPGSHELRFWGRSTLSLKTSVANGPTSEVPSRQAEDHPRQLIMTTVSATRRRRDMLTLPRWVERAVRVGSGRA